MRGRLHARLSLASLGPQIFSKTLTAAAVIILGTPFECQDYAYKVRGPFTTSVASALAAVQSRMESCVQCS